MKFLLFIVGLWAASAQALPEAVRESATLERRGSAELRWFGLPIYRATLWTSGSELAPPLALVIEYRRNLRGARIARSSVEEMRRLGADEANLARWGEAMQALFPDVREGDRLTGVHLRDGGARFYLGEHYLGEIADPAFARHFFAIWLDARTRAPEVRDALLLNAR